MKVEQQQDLNWMAPWSQKFCQVTRLPLMISKTLYVLTFPTYSIFTILLRLFIPPYENNCALCTFSDVVDE